MSDRELMELAGLLDDDLIVRAAGTVGRKEKSMRKNKVWKTALIAACVCLVLVGTVFAANTLYGIFDVNNGDSTLTRTLVVKRFGQDQVSEEARQAMAESAENIAQYSGSEESPIVHKVMGSWQEVQERIGVDLVDSALLDGAEPANYWPRKCYTVTFYPDSINASRSHIVDGMTVNLYVTVLMSEDGAEAAQSDAHTMGEDGNNTSYTLPDGTKAYYWFFEDSTWGYPIKAYTAYFVRDGIQYTLTTSDTQQDRLSAEDGLTAGLRLNDPHVDYDGIFFRVLDSLSFA